MSQLKKHARARGNQLWIKLAGAAFITTALLAWLTATGANAASEIDPKAEKLLRAMADHLGGAKTLGMRVSSTFDRVLESGIKLKIGLEQEVVLSRPGRMHARSRLDDGRVREIWFENGRVTVYTNRDNTFASAETPKDIDGMLDFMEEKYAINHAVADLLYSKPAKVAGKFLLSGAYIGLRMVAGVPCHHLSFESWGADWQLWIKDGADPVPCRLVITSVTKDAQPELIATFRDVTIDAETSDALFRFQAPSGATEKQLTPLKPE